MAYVTAAVQLLQSFLEQTGRFPGGVVVGRITAAPNTPAAAVSLFRSLGGLLTMRNFRRERDVTVRIYVNMDAEPTDDAEMALDELVYDLEQKISADLNLSATGWKVMGDIIGTYDFETVGNQTFRTVDLIVPLIYSG